MPRYLSRRTFLHRAAAVPAAAALALSCEVHAATPDAASLAWLRDLAVATIEAARIRAGQEKRGAGTNRTGITLITPGGNYPALWIRDFAMSLDCGLIKPDEILPQLRLIAQCQNGPRERRLASGAIIPPFAIPDHINLAGGAVFYPGTYSSGEDQGAAPWGPLPPVDDHFYFIHIAWSLLQVTRDPAFLAQAVEHIPLLVRLCQAFASPEADPLTGAAISPAGRRAVGFGFHDTVHLQGAMCFATLLRYQAAGELADLCAAAGDAQAAAGYRDTAKRIAGHIAPLFADAAKIGGWLRAATEVGRQPDVWATLFALHLKALPDDFARTARSTIAAAIRNPARPNSIEYQGAVRHIPVEHDFSDTSAWERCVAARNTYQNGAYWHVPTGWLIGALRPSEPDLAAQVFARFMDHLRQHDFRKGRGSGAPWECFGAELLHAQNPVYLASVTVPLGTLQ